MQELREQQMNMKYLINPFGKIYQYWSIYVTFLALMIILFQPYRIFFNMDIIEYRILFWGNFDILVLYTYCIKILVEMNLPFIHSDGRCEYNRKLILIRYFRFQIYIDIITAIPIFENSSDDSIFII